MNIRILLPSVVRILRDRANQSIHTDHSEFHLYYRNFIFPLREEWDVQIVCRYGKNRGDCWYMSDNFPRDVNDFPLIVRVVDEEGEILAEKEIKVRLYDKHFDSKPFSVMFFGDSMTHGGVYPLRVVERLANIKSEGTRSFNGWLRLEGRGGWSFTQYLNGFDARSCKPTSPFLFPEGEEGAYYWGDEANWAAIRDEAHDTYRFDGYTYEECQEGFTFLRKGALYCRNNGQDTLVAEKPVFSFAFDKYLARNRIHDLGAVSILMGANDLQCTPAADLSGALTQYIQGMKTVVDSIRQSDERTAVILNIPVPGSAQYAWGEQLGCYATAKQYRRNMAAAADAILREFDGREDENIYLCPMHAALDTESGFATAAVHPDCYSQTFRTHGANWVHPSPAGYYQMGDALCAVVEAVRQKREISG